MNASYNVTTAYNIVPIKFWHPNSHGPLKTAPDRASNFVDEAIYVQEIEGEIKAQSKHDVWIGAHVRSDAAWPQKPHFVVFEDTKIYVVPPEDDFVPVVFALQEQCDRSEIQAKILRFLSAWTWTEKRGIRVIRWTTGNRPHRVQPHSSSVSTIHFEFDYLPQNQTANTQRALAFYREGLSLDHSAYGFLSFYKVINVLHKGGAAQKRWIKGNIQKISGERVRKRINELTADSSVQRIEDYIYNACRNAVAHSHIDKVVVNPDDPLDEARLLKDLPIIQALAEHLINTEFGIPNSREVWESTSRRIAGAAWMVGDRINSRLIAGKHVAARNIQLSNKVRIKARGKEQYSSLCDLYLSVRHSLDGCVSLKLQSGDQLVSLLAGIDFVEGVAYFDPDGDHFIGDNGTAKPIKAMMDLYKLNAELFCNGRFQIIDQNTGVLLAESKPYVPVNMYFDSDAHERGLNTLKKRLDEREVTLSDYPPT